MNILMLNFTLPWRSTFFRAFYFAKGLAKRGHQVTLISVSAKNVLKVTEETVDGVRFVEMPEVLFGKLRSGWDFYDVLRRIIYLRGRDFDLVHGFDCRPVVIYPALYEKRMKNVPFVSDWADWWGRGGVIDWHRGWFFKTFFGGVETYYEEAFRKDADALTVISMALRKRAVELGVPKEKVHYVSAGVDAELMRPLDKDDARMRLGIPKDARLLGYTGFVQYDLDLVFDSLRTLVDKGVDVRLLLAGPVNKKVKTMIESRGLSKRVIAAGVVGYSEIPLYLSACDVLLMPFRDRLYNVGRFPIKFGEYLAAGRPVLTNKVGDIGALCADKDVCMFAEDSPEDFADKAKMLLDNAELSKHLAEKGRAFACEHLRWNDLASRICGIYEGLF